MTTRKEYIEKTKTKLDKLDTELSKLEARADAAKGNLKKELDGEVNDIKQSKLYLEAKMHELRSAGDAAWEDLKAGAELAWQSLSDSVESATQRFR